ncbi:hypothetical protein U7118_08145 [Bacillus subtilis]|jgi:hypothetical protein|uniref:hypothetical protein n=1 Tax=Bacillus subtilis group TaxID=653685 RepID=UPI002B4BC2A2|nr:MULTISPECIES: hypothetical protein [Bacillus subtilis group]MEC0565991.1 hypothetical protein [Bacillus spizizenii]MEC1755676.1 hypothetical protein [Bacillus mojavensis]WRK89190.1 hypothetical protein U7118_08145 [Bacillus subtilis]
MKRKLLMTIGSLSMASSLFLGFSNSAVAASSSDAILLSAGSAYTGYVDGAHGYGRWTVQSNSSTATGILYEKCGSTEKSIGQPLVAENGKSASSSAYMQGGCKYRVLLSAGSGGGKAYIRNTN